MKEQYEPSKGEIAEGEKRMTYGESRLSKKLSRMTERLKEIGKEGYLEIKTEGGGDGYAPNKEIIRGIINGSTIEITHEPKADFNNRFRCTINGTIIHESLARNLYDKYHSHASNLNVEEIKKVADHAAIEENRYEEYRVAEAMRIANELLY